MTTITLNVARPAFEAAPRGARWAAEAFARLMWALTPAPRALASTRAEEAEAVRRLAREVQDHDPGFAADLYAAAARHESLDD